MTTSPQPSRLVCNPLTTSLQQSTADSQQDDSYENQALRNISAEYIFHRRNVRRMSVMTATSLCLITCVILR